MNKLHKRQYILEIQIWTYINKKKTSNDRNNLIIKILFS